MASDDAETGELSSNVLPEGCIANVLSFTSPQEACRFSIISSLFRSAAESDVLWERFLPQDYQSIISGSGSPQVFSAASSKKQLYLSLSDNPILIEDGKKSFSLEKKSGKKCYMISARDLGIAWGDAPEYWEWVSDPASRFSEVAHLLWVCWLEIRGKINTSMLSPATLYTTYLVFKFSIEALGNQPVQVTVGLIGGETSSARPFRWRPERRLRLQYRNVRRPMIGSSEAEEESSGQNYPKERGDGWLEIELGEYFTKEGEEGELEMRVLDSSGTWKRGLIVQGIEIRPKQGN